MVYSAKPTQRVKVHKTKKKQIVKKTICFSLRAEDGAQTRDPQLGRLMLYQLSYFRKILSEFCEIFATLGN